MQCKHSSATNHSSSGSVAKSEPFDENGNLINEVDLFKELDLFSKVFAADKNRKHAYYR
jgi:hypothetical protein